ncbi:hypothetical protein BU24DRAFT_229247 [Aaosphaeria arxii CBS 175.79]|uniref:Zn(2)-C6 fungal-type domain-containing protein n=1 Tax=Aaosphaeria arxii CBS 175.79 TaxID=1450172 RepID=A0A6A5XQK7_9PLEO|nr:uncharacterized protein BU24DRAFT_229247 [Aaosphaeria arxii CBS 175.79]KAF2015179.1 hypothetical protein BU24DRAFT_229247 [Aaosphaeria arxii CBS 175.79]
MEPSKLPIRRLKHHKQMQTHTGILEFPTLKKTRRFGAKVKTGCRTCKIRRIKCDERRPECERCTSTGRKCEGYIQDKQDRSESLLLTKSSAFLNISPAMTELGEGVLYLEFYHHCGSPTISDHFDHEFWSRTVLQMAQSEPAIKHALIAIGYLIKTEPGDLRHARLESVNENRKILLVHYNKSVRCLVDRMEASPSSVEVSLVTCMLFICIEFIRGDYHAAFSHLYSGLKVIAEWRQQQQQQRLNHFKLLPDYKSSGTVTSHIQGSSNIISDKLSPMFNRAMTTALLFGAPFEPQLELFCPPTNTLKCTVFATVFQAQAAMHELRNASLFMISIIFRKSIRGAELSPEEKSRRADLLASHDSWHRALQDLENGKILSKKDQVVASSLKVFYYCVVLALIGVGNLSCMALDAHLSSFQALNRHARLVLDSMDLASASQTTSPTPSPSTSPSSKGSPNSSNGSLSPLMPIARREAAHFTFEMSVIVPLYWAATNCRCPATRRESVALLEKDPPREAFFEARMHAVVARRVIQIEEREVDPETGWPIQRSRLVSALVSSDMDRNGRFYAAYRSLPWVLRSMDPNDPERHPGDTDPKGQSNEWIEWFQL